MCKFFSIVSNGKGKIYYFTPEDVVSIMATGNKENYDFNSHTSLLHFKKVLGKNEDVWNKWEYDPDKKELAVDSLVTLDDRDDVKKHVEAFFDGKDVLFLRNIFGRNSGNLNSGYRNSGDRNSGNRNSGNRNSGDRNSGYLNSGDRNSGYLNSDTPTVRMFNRDTGKKWDEIRIPSCLFNLEVTRWIEFSAMSDEEKISHPKAYVCDGYLKTVDYKTAWENLWETLTDTDKKDVFDLPNFDAKVFEEITGIRV